jgi:hypothetical protein
MVVIALALGGCGGNGGGGSDGNQSRGDNGDQAYHGNGDQIAHVINESFTSSDPNKCTAFHTQQYLEQVQGLKGEAAVEFCQRTAALGNAKSVTSSSFFKGDTAIAKVAITGSELGGQTLVIRLVKDGDQWKLDQAIRFASFDREAWNSAASETLRELGLSVRAVNCVMAQSKRFSDSEVQDAYLGHPRPLQRIFVECGQKVHSSAVS